jgi:acyl-coenzyme A synthetase/AMP-(fatty) acid ligase
LNVYSTWESGDISVGLGKLGQGSVLPGVGVAILDAEKKPVGMGCVGSVVVSGPQLSDGYTVESITQEKFTRIPGLGDQTWYATGDRGRLLPDGLLVLGRTDFTLNIRGFKVALAVVDGALRAVPGVEQAVAVPVVDDKGNPQAIGAYVRGGSFAEVEAACRAALPAMLPPQAVPIGYRPLPIGKQGDKAPSVRSLPTMKFSDFRSRAARTEQRSEKGEQIAQAGLMF